MAGDDKTTGVKANSDCGAKFLVDMETIYTILVSTVYQIRLCQPPAQRSPQKERYQLTLILNESWRRRGHTSSATASGA
jgi:hypothetical protein